jgi:ADP-glucose pyrophosphorylase
MHTQAFSHLSHEKPLKQNPFSQSDAKEFTQEMNHQTRLNAVTFQTIFPVDQVIRLDPARPLKRHQSRSAKTELAQNKVRAKLGA